MANRVGGLDRLKRKLEQLPQILRDEVREALDQSANEMADMVRTNLPNGPDERGHIRDSVAVKEGRHGLSVEVSMGDGAHPYAAPLEFGHANGSKHTPATPVFFPARKVVGKKHRNRVRRAFRRGVKKIT
jgi:HK97 gp10 family phage protein